MHSLLLHLRNKSDLGFRFNECVGSTDSLKRSESKERFAHESDICDNQYGGLRCDMG
ncbi:hypothetical protein M9458_041650, partial [Cirrhinus mrigala]